MSGELSLLLRQILFSCLGNARQSRHWHLRWILLRSKSGHLHS